MNGFLDAAHPAMRRIDEQIEAAFRQGARDIDGTIPTEHALLRYGEQRQRSGGWTDYFYRGKCVLSVGPLTHSQATAGDTITFTFKREIRAARGAQA